MSGVVLDVAEGSNGPSASQVVWGVLLGYSCAAVSLAILYLPLYELGFAPGPPVRPGPFPISGAWSIGADLVVATLIVLVAAWWIWVLVANAVRAPVSFGVVALAVAVGGYSPFLTLRPAALSALLVVPATAGIVCFAIRTTLPFPKPSRRVWAALALAGVVVFGSYRVYHPFIAFGSGDGSIDLRNPGWADLTITHVDGGYFASDPDGRRRQKLPFTVPARSRVPVWTSNESCSPSVVEVTFSVLGRESTQAFTVQPPQNYNCSSD